ncbi:methyl-accepting chemotaxis protein [Roseospira goensis]|uniref:Methyl-accepting chemotaxis protein n=1 Tax=Roseospira goensis TaxID=391922 RepID=A0A7W6S0S4_9PROT|nr:methyl-accepting chemotaxis protein [Roseospira goensis]MBB4286164.1 methyl-accepting chemotaxis protein [Roseospira goensis]
MLSNIRIGLRLLILTGVTILALAGIGAVGVSSTSTVQSMLDQVRDTAQTPVTQFATINELLSESFQQPYAASLHNPDLDAAAHHDHPVGMHTDATRAAVARIADVLATYRASAAGDMFPAQLAAFEAAWADYLDDGLRDALALADQDRHMAFEQLGVHLTTVTLPRFRAAKAAAAAMLAAHNEIADRLVAEAQARYALALWTIAIGGLFAALIVFAGSLLIGRSITRPVAGMCGAMGDLAEGNLETEVPARERGDELGRMAAAVQVFKENAQRVKEMEAEQAAQAARAAEEKRQAMHTLADAFEREVGGVVEAVAAAARQLQSTAESMASIAEETNSQATTVAAASEQASTNVQTVASAAEELATSIREVGRQVQQSSDTAGRAATEAERTNAVVSGLADAAQKIGDVVNLISDIADQTNLLALNATIEAARAGDAGKGFAVVANEVKSLATQTAKATQDIGQQIGSVQSETRTAVAAIESISGIIHQINEVTSAIAAAMEEQNAATEEIARNVQQASQGTTEVSQTIVGVTEAARESGSAADHVLQATRDLTEQSSTLTSMVDRFLADVRAG